MDTTNDFRIDQGGCLETLAKRIEQQLKKREFCVVFEAEIERCWPRKELRRAQQERQIQAFAKSQGWKAFIYDSDSGRVSTIFQKDAVVRQGKTSE